MKLKNETMPARLGQVLCIATLALTTPAMSAEVWDCTFPDPERPGYMHVGEPGISRIRIDGDTLELQFMPKKFLLKPNAAPTWTTFWKYQILQNTEVGIVAVRSETRTSHALGIAIYAEVLMLDKGGTFVKDSANLFGG